MILIVIEISEAPGRQGDTARHRRSRANYLELLQLYVEEQHELQVQKRHSEETTSPSYCD